MANEYIVLNTVKAWVEIDNTIQQQLISLNLLKQEKKRINLQLLELMKSTNTDCYNTQNCQLLLKRKNIKNSINKHSLYEVLSSYYIEDPLKANELLQLVLQNRKSNIKEVIVKKSLIND